MNIFALHEDPNIAATQHCDSHVVKMILESAQMLCTAMHDLRPGNGHVIPYRKTHGNHPCTMWVKRSRKNFEWLVQLGLALSDEHLWRYEKNTYHKSRDVIMWCGQNVPHEDRFLRGYQTKFTMAMPNEIKIANYNQPIQAYREYYHKKAGDFKMTWRKRPVPSWFKPTGSDRSEYVWTPNEDQEPLSSIPFNEYIKRVTK